MTATLPPEIRDVLDRFITTEYTTVTAAGQPITWPVTPYHHAEAGCVDVTTGLGYPKKADDARANPRVALLFSDPTGSGIERAPMVLVQGTARVDEEDLEHNRERYWRESTAKLPAAAKLHPPKLVRGLFDWYYTRIYVHVRPERVFVWEDGDPSREPTLLGSHMEEVRSGHDEEPDLPLASPQGGTVAWDERIDELGREYPTAVVAVVGPDGWPFAARVPIRPDRATGRIRLDAEPVGAPWQPGRACLAAHAHAHEFAWQRNFQVRGDLIEDEGGWALVPHRLVGGFELPPSRAAAIRENLAKARRFRRTAKRRAAARSRAR